MAAAVLCPDETSGKRVAWNRNDGPCRKCGGPVTRRPTKRRPAGERHCLCDRHRKRNDAPRTPEQRRAERQRIAERKGRSYTPGVKPWEAPRTVPDARNDPTLAAETYWRRLERANARQAWEWWLSERAPGWWLAARDGHHRREAKRLLLDPDFVARSHWSDVRRTIEKAGGGGITRATIAALLRHAGHCLYCGRDLFARCPSIDHLDPLVLGGAHSLHNLVVCCRACNCSKNAKPFAVWLGMLDEPYRSRCRKLYARRMGDGRQAILL